MIFPLATDISVSADLKVDHKLVWELIGPMLTSERQTKIAKVAAKRNFGNAVVMEGIYDRGNISAVMRSAEAFGFANIHVIETGEKFKESNRVTQGADKWLEVQKWKTTQEAVHELKRKGHRIVVTTLEASRPIHEVDFSQPTALVLGNEKDGASREMIEMADERIIIPMLGFVQSFNISVAAAIGLYHIYQDRMQKLGRCEDVTTQQIEILKAHYAIRTQDSSFEILKNKFSGKSFA